MSKIRVLPDHLVNQIAAGEVIERPAAALKELVENALDAGARQIDVTLRDGGKSFIAVRDNGIGMSADDMALAMTRHATSKLPDDDLVNIHTLGFRGEALPSIGSVARLSLTSRPHHAEHAWCLRVEGGVIQLPVPAAQAPGTVVEVRDLFYLTPARLKFLKADVTEYAACKDILVRLAFAHPAVGFTLSHQGATVLSLPAITVDTHDEALAHRARDILGNGFHDNTVEIDATDRDVTIRGRIGYPTFNRGQANTQYLFVNGRPVKDRLLLGALRAAYGDLMPRDRHAVALLFIDLPATDVDVNVHPAKAEVRFRDNQRLRGFLISAIRQRLAALSGTSTNHGQALIDHLLAARVPTSAPLTQLSDDPGLPYLPANEEYGAPYPSPTPLFQLMPALRSQSSAALSISSAAMAETVAAPVAYPLGAACAQIHGTYIIAQTAHGVALIDQHAAHERLTYERYKRQITETGITSQRLMTPEVVMLDDVQATAVLSKAETLLTYGLEVDHFGPDCVLVRAVPADIADRLNISSLIIDLADEILEKGSVETLESRLLYFLATRACHRSVRAGQPLSVEEMNALLRQIEETPHAAQCNHGRPTYVMLNLADLERLFERR